VYSISEINEILVESPLAAGALRLSSIKNNEDEEVQVLGCTIHTEVTLSQHRARSAHGNLSTHKDGWVVWQHCGGKGGACSLTAV
jgi:hypothetical protein